MYVHIYIYVHESKKQKKKKIKTYVTQFVILNINIHNEYLFMHICETTFTNK